MSFPLAIVERRWIVQSSTEGMTARRMRAGGFELELMRAAQVASLAGEE
jgi:hypothetical protein